MAPTTNNAVDELREELSAQYPLLFVEPNDETDKLLRVLLTSLDRIDLDIDELFDERFVATATGRELERLGANVGIDRKTNEDDDTYRLRVRAGYAAANSAGTYEDIARVATLLLDTDPEAIELERAENTADPATAVIKVTNDVLDASPFTTSEITNILGDAVVGGHRIEIQTTDGFTWGDSSLGWDTEWATVVST
jgi:hypothetical protein